MKRKAELLKLDIDQIVPHPDNPRILLREDVITAIVANLDGEFPEKHAIHTRPVGKQYQVIAGHQRLEAAKRKGLSSVWSWVDELDDAEAFMQLATSNAQGELSPLEIGIHAFKAVPPAQGKKDAGLKDYASRLSKTGEYIGQLRQAAEVLTSTSKLEFGSFLEKAKHLCAVHRLPRTCWQEACEWLATNEASVADVEHRVKQAMEYGHQDGVTAEWKQYLPRHACIAAVFTGTDPNNFSKLLALANKVLADLPEDLGSQWSEWLVANRFADSWDIRKVQDKRIELEGIAWERDNKPTTDLVSVLLADPPWQYDFAETDNRQIENKYPSATPDEISSHCDAPWFPKLTDDCVLFLWATAPKLQEALEVMHAWGFTYKTNAVWDKEKIGMGYWFRGQHELLLVGTRGSASPPEQADRVASVFRESRRAHSQKPECVYAAIEDMFPDAQLGEVYQRTERKPRWIGFGNEAK